MMEAGWIAFGALWVIGMLPSYIVADEIMDVPAPLLFAVAWPFVTLLGVGWWCVLMIGEFALWIRKWWWEGKERK